MTICINLTTIAPFAVLMVAIITGGFSIYLWSVNKKHERETVDRLKREERYKGLIENLEGFFTDGVTSAEEKTKLKSKAIAHYNLMALYCSDGIHKKATEFFESIKHGSTTSDNKAELIKELILLMRKDMGWVKE